MRKPKTNFKIKNFKRTSSSNSLTTYFDLQRKVKPDFRCPENILAVNQAFMMMLYNETMSSHSSVVSNQSDMDEDLKSISCSHSEISDVNE